MRTGTREGGSVPRRGTRPQPGVATPDLCTHPGRTVATWKTRLEGAKEHRLEAYATLVLRTIERFLRGIPEAIAVDPEWRRDGVK
jgi:hypothetical protein